MTARQKPSTPPTQIAHLGSATSDDPPVIERSAPLAAAGNVPWERLNARMILVDALRLALSAAPAVVAFSVVDVEPTWFTTAPLVLILLIGTISSVADVIRWLTTGYRINDTHVERRTGIFVRRYRSVPRERIRSVESEAKLRHQLFGLRLVRIGAGQQNTTGESALVLDAVSRHTAESVRERLLDRPDDTAEDEQIIQCIRYHWFVYNILDSYAYIVAIGALWGLYILLATFGIDPLPIVQRIVDWERIGWGPAIAAGLLVVGALGAMILIWQFFNENWDFRLSRVRTGDGTVLRTTQGLLRTREVDRECDRMRGAVISEPLLWRWMRIADTEVMTTGLAIWSMSPTILPRGPISVARRVVAEVLAEASPPLEAELLSHPRSALRRRLMWATGISAIVTATTAWVLATAGVSGQWPWWATALIIWPPAVLLALAGYLHLGHGTIGRYAVVQGKVMSRATSALQTRAISGLTVKQSILQARLGLATVSFTTAAGHGTITAADASVRQASRLIQAAVPDLSAPFLDHRTKTTSRKETTSC